METLKIPVLTELSTEELLEIIEGARSHSMTITRTRERRINDKLVTLERRRALSVFNNPIRPPRRTP